jgi:hypothetical protein
VNVHVRWPARPAEHRAGLDFLLFLFFVSRQRKERHLRIDFFDDVCSFFCLCKRKNETCLPAGREKHTGNDPIAIGQPLPNALINFSITVN